MKLFTKQIDTMLFKQYPMGYSMGQKVVAKIFNPYGRGRWYLMNSDPNDPDYLWGIVQMGNEVEIGSISRRELENIRFSAFRLPLERDLSFSPMKASDVYEGLKMGKVYKKGGFVEREANKDMLLNYAQEFKHHSTEFSKAAKESKEVMPWVIAKAERASTDLSDITHYLDGENSKYAEGGITNGYYETMANGGSLDGKLQEVMKDAQSLSANQKLKTYVFDYEFDRYNGRANEPHERYSWGYQDDVDYFKEKGFDSFMKVIAAYDKGVPVMANGGDTDEGVDLFEDYDNIPPKVQKVLDKYSDDFEDGNYDGLGKALKELNKIGYTFEFYLDGQAYDLRKIGQKGKSEDSPKMEKGGLKGDVHSLTDKLLSQKIQIFLGKIKPIKYYYIDEESNSLIVGLDENYTQDAADKLYKEATSSMEFFDADSVDMEYFPKTKDTQYTIKLKKPVKFASGGMMAKGGGIKKEWVAIYVNEQKPNERKVISASGSTKEEAIRDARMSEGYYGIKKPFELFEIFTKEDTTPKMAQGGEIRYKVKGNNFSAQIENGREFKKYIEKAYNNQSDSEKQYPLNFITEVAYTGKIVKNEGSNYVKDYSYKGTLTKFAFLDDADFIKALSYLERPAIRKMEDGGKMAMGGKVTFQDKVDAISKRLIERRKVSPSVQKDYGKTYSKKEAQESARRIVGAMKSK